MRPTLELDVVHVDPRIHHIDVHTRLQGSRRVVVPLQRTQGKSRSVGNSSETPRSRELLGDIVRIGKVGRVLRDEDRGLGSDRSSVLGLVMTEIYVDDLVVLDIINFGGGSNELQGGFAECSSVSVESMEITTDTGRLVDLGDSSKVVSTTEAQGLFDRSVEANVNDGVSA
jgi:hypothetical protein